jgi:hypothetical protein
MIREWAGGPCGLKPLAPLAEARHGLFQHGGRLAVAEAHDRGGPPSPSHRADSGIEATPASRTARSLKVRSSSAMPLAARSMQANHVAVLSSTAKPGGG